MVNVMRVQINVLNQTNFANNRTLGVFDKDLNSRLSGLSTNISSMLNAKKYGECVWPALGVPA